MIYFSLYDNFMKSATIFSATILQMENRASKVKLLVQCHITNDYRQNKNPSLGLSVTGTQVLYHYFKQLLINLLVNPRNGDVFIHYDVEAHYPQVERGSVDHLLGFSIISFCPNCHQLDKWGTGISSLFQP